MLHFLVIGLLAASGTSADLAPGALQRGLDGAGCSYSQLPASSAAAPLTLARASEPSYSTPAFLVVDSRSAEDTHIAIARIHVGGVEYALDRSGLDRSGSGGSSYVSTRGDLRVVIRARSRAQSTCGGRECEGTFRMVNVQLTHAKQHAQISAIEHCGA